MLAYDQDPVTKELLDILCSTTPVDKKFISSIHSSYRQALATYRLKLLKNHLVLLEPVENSQKHLHRIVVPLPLRQDVYSLFHVFPSVGHMGEYKTLYRIKLQLFCPRMRQDIKDWTKACPQYNITLRWRRCGSELLFSWPVSSPFSILYVDLWYPGNSTNHAGEQYLLNTMCDITQFVVYIPVPGCTSTIISKFFMKDVLLKFGICSLVVIGDGTSFKGAFTSMYGALY